MSNRPAIPAEIEREILLESGHRCAVCGTSCPLERAHIIPWHKSREHKAQNLICLCANCHERADKENWSEKTLREHKRMPWVLRQYKNVEIVPESALRLEITIDMDSSERFDDKNQRWLQYGIAAFLEIPPQAVKIVAIEQGSVKVTIELSAQSANRLVIAYQEHDPELIMCLAPLILLDLRRKTTGGEGTHLIIASQELDRKQFFQPVVETIRMTLGLPVSMWLPDKTGEILRIIAATKELPNEYVRKATLRLDETSVASEVFATGQPIVVRDIASDQRWKYKAEAAAMGLKSAMVVPLQVKKKTVGVLDVYAREARDFSDFEKALTQRFAAQLAITQRRLQDLAILNEVSLWINSELHLSELFKRLTQSAARVLDCQHVSVFLKGKAGDLVQEASSAADIVRRQFAPGEGLAGLVVETGQSVLVPDAVNHPRFIPGLFSDITERSMLLVPITVDGEVVGVISADRDGLNAFDEQDQSLLETLASQAAVAVRNARLLERETSRAAVLEKLHQIGEQLLSVELSTRGLRRVLRQVARSARSVLNADLVDVYQYIEAEKRYMIPPILEGERRDPSVPKDAIFPDDVVARLVLSGKPRYSPDAQNEPLLTGSFTVERPNRPDRRFVVREGVVSSAAVPLKAADETVGAMFINYRTRQEFTADRREAIELFANQAAIAIQNARVYEQIQKRVGALKALNEVGQRLSTVEVTGKGLSRLLRQVARQAKRVLGADLIELYRVDPGREDRVTAHVSAGKKLVDIKPSKKILPDDVAAEILHLSTPLFAHNAQQDPLLSGPFRTDRVGMPDQRFVKREHIASSGAVPLVVGDEAVGILFVNYRSPQRFPPEQQELIQLFANQAAVAIRNAQLFQQRETLQDIARDITSVPDRDRLLQRTLERSLELLSCEFGSISIFDSATNELQFRYAVGKSPDMSVKLGQGLIGTAANTRRPVRVADVSQDDRYVCHVEETRSELDVPMLVGERLIGVLNAESRRLNAFSEADQHLAEALAAQAAVAFRTAELLEEVQARLQERVDDIQALQGIYALIGTAPLEDLLEQIAEEAARLTPARYTSVWLLDERTHELRFGARNETGIAPTQTFNRLPIDATSINGHVALTGKTYLCADVRDDPYYWEWYEEVQSELTTPLVHSGRVIGTLDLESAEVAAFTEDHVRLVEALARAASVAIQSARLYERLNTLASVGQAVTSTLDLDSVLDRIMQEAVDALEASYGTLRLLDRTTSELRLRARRGEISDRAHDVIPMGRGIVGWVAEHGEPLLVPEVEQDERYLKYLEGTRSELAVPIKLDDTTIGVLNIEHVEPHAFDEHDVRLLEAVASQAATAIRNARLYEAMQTVNEVGQALTSGIRLREEQVLELIHEQASKLMDMDNTYIALYDESTDIVRFGLAFERGRRVGVETEKGWQPRKAGEGRTEEIIRTEEPIFTATRAEGEAWYAQPGHEEYLGRPFASWLGVPMMVGEKVLGVIATYHPTQDHVYSRDDLEILQAMANQAAIALDNAHMFYDVNQRLATLVEFGRVVSSGIRQREDEVLELIHEQASKLMDTGNMYVALYDEMADTVRFPLALVDGEPVQVETRKAGKGKTEHIIRTMQPIFHDTKEEAEKWYAEPEHEEYVGRISPSWLGVPMIMGESALGVIAVYHPDQDHVYRGDDLEILRAMANQAAVALENAALYAQAREEAIAARQLATLGTAAAALQHRINNTLNIILPNVRRLRGRVDISDETIREILDIIERNARYSSQAVSRIMEPLKDTSIQKVNVNALIADVARELEEQHRAKESATEIAVTLNLEDPLPEMWAASGHISEVFRTLIENCFNAMEETGGEVTVNSRRQNNDEIVVEVKDTGPGIPANVSDKLFHKPVPSDKPGGSAGLGLWLTGLLLQKYGGRVTIAATGPRGTVMSVRIPTSGGLISGVVP